MATQSLIKVNDEVIKNLDLCAKEAQELALSKDSTFDKAIKTAALMQRIRGELVKPGVMAAIVSLQNSAVGFKTDRPNEKKPTPYNDHELVDPAIEAVMRGFSFVGNEFNVIAGNFYGAKEGLGRKIRELPDLTNVKIIPGIPQNVGDKGAIVSVDLTWRYKGVDGKETLKFAIRVNYGQGADAINGKVIRKARAWLLGYLTGSEMPEGEVDDMELKGAKNITPQEPDANVSDRLKTAAGKKAESTPATAPCNDQGELIQA